MVPLPRPAAATDAVVLALPITEAKDPCIKLCRMDADGICLGCFRTKAEIKGWKRLSAPARAAIVARVLPRMRAAADGSGKAARKARKRLKKLDRKIGKLQRKLAALQAERHRLAAPATRAASAA